MDELEKKFIQVIPADLYESPLKWSVEKAKDRFRFPDMTINIEDEEYNRWYLELRPSIPSRRHPIVHPFHLYSRIVLFEFLETDKLTIVVNDEKDFNMILKRPPLSLRANLYVMLIDLEWGKILKEKMLCRYRKD